MRIRNLKERVQRLFGERLGLHGDFGRLPERRRFELTDEHLKMIAAGARRDRQERERVGVSEHTAMTLGTFARWGNNAWSNIGRELGFDWRTVQPTTIQKPGEPVRYFTAIPLPQDERNGGSFVIPVVGKK